MPARNENSIEGEKSRLGRDVDVVDIEPSLAAAVCEVHETDDGDGDVAKFTFDESNTSDKNCRPA